MDEAPGCQGAFAPQEDGVGPSGTENLGGRALGPAGLDWADYIILNRAFLKPYFKSVGGDALGTYMGLLSLQSDADKTFRGPSGELEFRPSMRQLEESLDLSHHTILKHIRALQAAGLLEVIKTGPERAGLGLPEKNRYILREPGRGMEIESLSIGPGGALVAKFATGMARTATGEAKPPIPVASPSLGVAESATGAVESSATGGEESATDLPAEIAGDPASTWPIATQLLLMLLGDIKPTTSKTRDRLEHQLTKLRARFPTFSLRALKPHYQKALELFPTPDQALVYLAEKIQVVLDAKKVQDPRKLLMMAVKEGYQGSPAAAAPSPARAQIVPASQATQPEHGSEARRKEAREASAEKIRHAYQSMLRLHQAKDRVLVALKSIYGENPNLPIVLAELDSSPAEEAGVVLKEAHS